MYFCRCLCFCQSPNNEKLKNKGMERKASGESACVPYGPFVKYEQFSERFWSIQ